MSKQQIEKAHIKFLNTLDKAEEDLRKVLDKFIDFEYGLVELGGDGWCIYAPDLLDDDLCDNFPVSDIEGVLSREDYIGAIKL